MTRLEYIYSIEDGAERARELREYEAEQKADGIRLMKRWGEMNTRLEKLEREAEIERRVRERLGR